METTTPIIRIIEEGTSTNILLNEWIKEEQVPEGSILAARSQTAGKGQKGNSWHSEPGENLTFSMVLYPHSISIQAQFIISQIVSLAVKQVIDPYVQGVSIKWPNDIYVGERKIAGILIENNLSGRTIDSCIIGIGLNVNQKSFPDTLPNPISLYQLTQQRADLDRLLQTLQQTIYTDYLRFLADPNKKATIQQAFHMALFRREGLFPYFDRKNNELIMARIESVAPNGTLSLRLENGTIRNYQFKEVEYIL